MVKDLLAAGRIANLPTVWTNVLVGASLAHVSSSFDEFDGVRLLMVMLAGSLLYVAGCFYNDYYDRDWDAEHKPERAIPAGRLSASFLKKLILLFGVLGVGLCFSFGLLAGCVSLVIIGFIILYTRIHKRTAFAILPMGMCRAGLYSLGFFSMHGGSVAAPSVLVLPALGLISYIAGITLVARSEATNTLPVGAKWVGLLLLAVPLLTHTFSLSTYHFIVIICGVVVLYFLKRLAERSVGGFVSLCLAGICLVDGILLSSLAPDPTSMWICVLLSLAGFAFSRLLQKVAPAT